MLERCDGPACRLRAEALELGVMPTVACLGRCDAPVAAVAAGRPLTLVRRGVVEPVTTLPPPRGPIEPLLLRDAGFADQPTLAAARRRGGWRELTPVDHLTARALVAVVELPPARGVGAFAGRVLGERDPHALLQGAVVHARAVGDRVPALRVPPEWSAARDALDRAAVEARDAGLIGEVAFDGDLDCVRAAAIACSARVGADWWRAHATRLCAVSGDALRPGVYELSPDATIADAVAAAGGVVDGVRTASRGTFIADGGLERDGTRAAPAGLVLLHGGRDPDRVR